MNNMRMTTLVVIMLFILFGLACIFTVREDQKALLLRLGKLERSEKTNEVDIYTPGLHFKMPIINNVRVFDTRLQTLDVKTSRIVTVKKKDVIVDYYVKWRINDLPLYFTRTGGNEFQAETLLEQKLNNGLRAEFGKRDISEVVSDDRSEIMHALQDDAANSAKGLGIEVVDVRIKRIDLPDKVSSSIFDRMRAERERVANQHRADGRAVAEKIRSTADKNAAVIVAEAEKNAEVIRGDGDATAAGIYAETFNKDKEFFSFYRSMEAYRQSFANKNDVLVLRPDSEFFKYFNEAKVTAKS